MALSNKVGRDFCKLSTLFHASAFLHSFEKNRDVFSFSERFFLQDLFQFEGRKDFFLLEDPLYLNTSASATEAKTSFLLISPKQHNRQTSFPKLGQHHS